MYKDSYNEYIRSVLGNTEQNNDNNLKYPEEDRAYYCDYSHPKNNMQQHTDQNNNINQYDNSNYDMANYNIMYSDYQNRYGMPNYYDYCDYPNGYNYEDTRGNSKIEECYPEIYGIVYPMVQKACRNITEPVSKEDVEKMVEELYGNLEGNDDINLNITLNNNIDNSNLIQVEQKQTNSMERIRTENNRPNNRSTGLFKPNVEPKRETSIPLKAEQKQDVRNNIQNSNILEKAKQDNKETRYCNNGLCDIIRILLVRELLGGPNRPGNRPPFKPYPPFGPWPGPRPPFGPGPRPPFFR